ncbi:MAG: NIPSNAP family protein [Pseudomonadota bacterium]
MAFYELRRYRVRDGRMQNWLQLMETQILPFVVSEGMVVTASYCDQEDDSLYYWIRRFHSEDDRIRLYAAVYESEYWTKTLAPQIGELLDREQIVIRRLVPTEKSPVQ